MRLRKGEIVSRFLAFAKESYPHITGSGKRKVKKAFFQCIIHPENYHKFSHSNAKRDDRKTCPCSNTFNEDDPIKMFTKEEVDDYSYLKEQNKHRASLKKAPPGWMRVTRIGIFLKKKDGTNLLFYKFPKNAKKSPEYRAAKEIEAITWNRPKVNRAFYMTRLSYKFDALHSEGLMNFKSELWNRGSGREFFEEFLKTQL